MTSEYNNYIKRKSELLGRSEASVRSKLYEMGVKANDTPEERQKKIRKYMKKTVYKK